MSYGQPHRPQHGLLEIVMYGILAIGPGFILDYIFGHLEFVAWIGAALGLFFVFCFNHILQDADDIARERDHEKWMRKGLAKYAKASEDNCEALKALLTDEQMKSYWDVYKSPEPWEALRASKEADEDEERRAKIQYKTISGEIRKKLLKK